MSEKTNNHVGGQTNLDGHVVLLGDSVFDNQSYVPGGPSVLEHLQHILPTGWDATLAAVDGATIADIEGQLEAVPDDATHLVLSVGGNDALQHSGFILSEPADSIASALGELANIRDDFARDYRQMLSAVQSRNLPLAACTIYDSVPGLGAAQSVGLSIFNETITREVIAAGATLIDLRLICDEATDYSDLSPIEPSVSGGRKIAQAICAAIIERQDGCRVVA